MKQSILSNWLKLIIIGVGICGCIIYLWVIPSYGQALVQANPEFAYCYLPWLSLLWVTGVPCCLALILAWRISLNIGVDRSFSEENAKLLKWISLLAAADSGFFFAMNIVYLLLNMNHPGIVLLSVIVVFVGVAVSVASAVLSHLVMKAAELQEQSDLTI